MDPSLTIEASIALLARAQLELAQAINRRVQLDVSMEAAGFQMAMTADPIETTLDPEVPDDPDAK